tara:strand:+ start:62 stop:601 length:540 start_codon:yes stop_codon:yes gene_type:complete
MSEKKIKTKFPGIVGKAFNKLPESKQKEVIKFMKTIPEYANKTATELKKIAKKVYTKLPTRKYRKPKERKELFDVSDLQDKSTMVGRNAPKQQMTRVRAKPMGEDKIEGMDSTQKIITSDDLYTDKATGKIKESLKTGSKEVRNPETPVFDRGKSRNPFGMNKGGRVRSYRGYGKARRG